nr:PREDICTED: putative late blight resistance protein homolog R1B-16 [Daucus carota subsp. sativus]
MAFQVDLLFHDMIQQVNRLLEYPKWLSVERSQISFYSIKLTSIYMAFQTRPMKCQDNLSELLVDTTLHILVRRILDSKNLGTSGEFSNLIDPPDLTLIGMRLAFEVQVIYKAFMQDSSLDLSLQDKDLNFTFGPYMNPDGDMKFQEVFIGFKSEASGLLQQLASITKKKLEVISVVGMAGLGKTTLATRLYNDPYVMHYFYIRAWVTCSQVYRKKDLLLSILRSVSDITDDICEMDDNVVAHHLYRALMGRRYLIVIDDIWSNEAWDDFKRCFPDDNNGSKIMMTTRLKDVALHAQPEGNPLCLRFLTEEESFDLLRRKAFIWGIFSGNLSLIGKSISSKCRGLPLAIVVIAGILKNKYQVDWWEQVAESVSSYILSDEKQYMDTLALSYNHLPQHLRPLFLSFGAFPEDHDIIWLWITEGFILPDSTRKSLEDVAEHYLMDLVSRSLVVAGKKGSNGSIKTCRIHDLLHDLCLRKAEEENFSPDIYKYNKHSYTFSQSNHVDVSITCDTSKLMRTLDLSSIELLVFPTELLQLVQLRYLELQFRTGNPPESISHLKELQTLIMSSRMHIVVPNNTWKMKHLKHFCIKSGVNLVNFSSVDDNSSLLEHLQTMSLVSPTRSCRHMLARTYNLQKLGLCGPMTTASGDLKFPDICHLKQLTTLKLLNTIPLCKVARLSDSFLFPETLKSLSLSNTYLGWKEAWAFEMIPNLEVLKLKFHAFVGNDWETRPEAFPHLKFLRLDELDIVTWTASRNHFPVLQRLQVWRCSYLMEIPEDFGNICTLEWIELSGCSDAAADSARDIMKEQGSNGNDWLKIRLNPGLTPS